MRRASIVLGDHPHFAPLRSGEVAPEGLELEFVDVEPTNRAFAPMLREGRYDISEMAITVFLQAVEVGKPVWLLPVVAVGGFHHGSIYCNPATGVSAPGDLAGRRVGVRAYSQTTGLYVRGVLAEEHGVSADQITWVTTEGSHVAEYEDPANVERSDESLVGLLERGEIDAAILGPGREPTPWCVPLIPDAATVGEAWGTRHGLIPINHMVCVGPAIAESDRADRRPDVGVPPRLRRRRDAAGRRDHARPRRHRVEDRVRARPGAGAGPRVAPTSTSRRCSRS